MAALPPKVGIESVRRAGPDGTAATMQQLLDRFRAANDDEKKIERLMDKLVK